VSQLRAFVRREDGAAAAELALMLPLLVIMLFGSIELSYYFYQQHQVVKGVRDGARYASRQSFTKINCASGVDGTVATAIKEVTRTGRPSGGTARVPGWVDGDITVAMDCPASGSEVTTGIYTGEANAPVVKITARVNYTSLFDGVGILTDSYHLNATQEAAVMGI
jgi:Flp pilus assembly protein TadG